MRIAGIDEAGRGAVLGPMVYACVSTDEEGLEQLYRSGIKDSKSMTKTKRNKLYQYMKSLDNIFIHISQANPYEITQAMRMDGQSLNTVAQKCATQSVDAHPQIDELYVDIMGSSKDYRECLKDVCGDNTQITIEKKADASYTIVAAASIVAKCSRDEQVPHVCGSGYPSDKRTKDWMNSNPASSFIRHSWSCAPYWEGG